MSFPMEVSYEPHTVWNQSSTETSKDMCGNSYDVMRYYLKTQCYNLKLYKTTTAMYVVIRTKNTGTKFTMGMQMEGLATFGRDSYAWCTGKRVRFLLLVRSGFQMKLRRNVIGCGLQVHRRRGVPGTAHLGRSQVTMWKCCTNFLGRQCHCRLPVDGMGYRCTREFGHLGFKFYDLTFVRLSGFYLSISWCVPTHRNTTSNRWFIWWAQRQS